MKKNGFTLPELLISMTLIAVIAAITAPMLSNLMPDSNKMRVLKYHKIIGDAVTEIVNDPSLYWNKLSEDDVECIGLGCTQAPMNSDYSAYSGENKFRDILWSKLEGEVDSTDSSKFYTIEGVELILTPTDVRTDSITVQDFYIEMDLDGDKGKHCHFSSECERPDVYRFWIDTYGNVKPFDPMTAAFIKNPTKLNDKAKDSRVAKKDTKSYTVTDMLTDNTY